MRRGNGKAGASVVRPQRGPAARNEIAKREIGTLWGRRQGRESFLQGSEPWLEVAPLIESPAIERLTDLLGARADDGARRFVKLETGGLRLEVAELEDALHVRREIRNQRLMPDPQYLPRQDGIPMTHEVHIHAVVPGQVLEAVDEPRSVIGGEELFEVAE